MTPKLFKTDNGKLSYDDLLKTARDVRKIDLGALNDTGMTGLDWLNALVGIQTIYFENKAKALETAQKIDRDERSLIASIAMCVNESNKE